MKRIIALLLVIVLGCTYLTVLAEEICEETDMEENLLLEEAADGARAGCTHTEYELIGDPAATPFTYSKYNSNYHRYARAMRAVCLKSSCSKVITVYVNVQYLPHQMIDDYNKHVEGTKTHRYYQKCSQCGYDSYYEMRCLDCE